MGGTSWTELKAASPRAADVIDAMVRTSLMALITYRYPGDTPVSLMTGAILLAVSVLTLALSYRRYVRRP